MTTITQCADNSYYFDIVTKTVGLKILTILIVNYRYLIETYDVISINFKDTETNEIWENVKIEKLPLFNDEKKTLRKNMRRKRYLKHVHSFVLMVWKTYETSG